MTATPRIQRRYDHRLQAIVKSAGSIEIALEHGIPRSTARGWLKNHNSPPVISTELVDQDTASLQWEVLALRRKVRRLVALLRLAFVVFKLSKSSFAKVRVQDAKVKHRVLTAIDQCREHMSLQMVVELSGSREADTTNGSKSVFVGLMIDLPAPRNQFTKSRRKKSV